MNTATKPAAARIACVGEDDPTYVTQLVRGLEQRAMTARHMSVFSLRLAPRPPDLTVLVGTAAKDGGADVVAQLGAHRGPFALVMAPGALAARLEARQRGLHVLPRAESGEELATLISKLVADIASGATATSTPLPAPAAIALDGLDWDDEHEAVTLNQSLPSPPSAPPRAKLPPPGPRATLIGGFPNVPPPIRASRPPGGSKPVGPKVEPPKAPDVHSAVTRPHSVDTKPNEAVTKSLVAPPARAEVKTDPPFEEETFVATDASRELARAMNELPSHEQPLDEPPRPTDPDVTAPHTPVFAPEPSGGEEQGAPPEASADVTTEQDALLPAPAGSSAAERAAFAPAPAGSASAERAAPAPGGPASAERAAPAPGRPASAEHAAPAPAGPASAAEHAAFAPAPGGSASAEHAAFAAAPGGPASAERAAFAPAPGGPASPAEHAAFAAAPGGPSSAAEHAAFAPPVAPPVSAQPAAAAEAAPKRGLGLGAIIGIVALLGLTGAALAVGGYLFYLRAAPDGAPVASRPAPESSEEAPVEAAAPAPSTTESAETGEARPTPPPAPAEPAEIADSAEAAETAPAEAAETETAPEPTEPLTPREARAQSDVIVAEAEAHERAGRLVEARDAFARAADVHHLNPHAHTGLARVALEMGDTAAAVEHAELAVRYRRNRAAYRVLLGDARRAAGDAAGAREAYREALELEPDNREARARLGSAAPAPEPTESPEPAIESAEQTTEAPAP